MTGILGTFLVMLLVHGNTPEKQALPQAPIFGTFLLFPLILVLIGILTLLLRRCVGLPLISLLVLAVILVYAIAWFWEPDSEELDRECLFGGTHEQYVACRAKLNQRVALRLGACIGVPTVLGVVCTMTGLWLLDKYAAGGRSKVQDPSDPDHRDRVT